MIRDRLNHLAETNDEFCNGEEPEDDYKDNYVRYAVARNSFTRFRAGLKVNLRQYIKSVFDLF